MTKKLLTEWLPLKVDKKTLNENRSEDGTIMLRGVIQRANTLNQNGRVYPMDILSREIDNYQKLDQRINLLSKSNVLMFDENLKGKSIQNIDQFNTDDKTEIIVIIGPEGGFEEKERQLIFKNSKTFQNVSLGPQILKADTAVIAALSLTFHYFS